MSQVSNVISPLDKTPGTYVQYAYNTGPNGGGSARLILLILGLKTADGTAVVESDLVDINDDATTAAKFGQKSQIRRLAKWVYSKGIRCKAMAIAEAASAVAASQTVTFTGTPTGSGTYTIYLAGEQAPISVNITTTDTPTTIATRLTAAINAVDGLPFIATSSTGVVTITCSQLGTHGNWYLLRQDKTLLAAGVTVAVSGTAISGGNVFRFAGGTGTESAANAIAAITGQKFRRIGLGTVDASNLGLWRTYVDTQEQALQGNPTHVTAACSDTSTVAMGLSMTTLNDQRFALGYLPNSETHPGELAASIAADRTLQEQIYPCYNFDDEVVEGAAPQVYAGDQLQHSQIQTLLDSGVTPLLTTPDGHVVIGRGIVTKCLNGTAPDYRCLDWADAVVPDAVGDAIADKWNNDFRPGNPIIQPELPDPSLPVPSGIGVPSAWNRDVLGVMHALEDGSAGLYPGPILIQVDEFPPVTQWLAQSKSFGTAVTSIAPPLNHRLDLIIRQRAAAAA